MGCGLHWRGVGGVAMMRILSEIYPPLHLPEATWKFITAHHAHPVKTTPHGGAECAMYDRKPGRPDPDPDARMCGNCEWFDADGRQCLWDGPVPESWHTDECSVSFYDGTDCQTFKKREPEIVPATIADLTGGPWNPAPPAVGAPEKKSCMNCKWATQIPYREWRATCNCPIPESLSDSYRDDVWPSSGSDCDMFSRKEPGDDPAI